MGNKVTFEPWDPTDHMRAIEDWNAMHAAAVDDGDPEDQATARKLVGLAMTRWLKSGGYGCEIGWSDADGCYVGRVTGTGDDVVGFHGDTPEGLVLAFEEAVADYTAAKASQRL